MPPEWFVKTDGLILLPIQAYVPPRFFSVSEMLCPFRYPLYWNPNAESIIINFQITKSRKRNFFQFRKQVFY